MGAVTDVFLITGFLGSGKTTLLNRLTKAFAPDLKIMILMNEFGEIGIDGLLVEGEDLDILEISRGSIFCVCVKTDFIKGMARIAQEIRPDVLIVEATGTADPGDMKRDLGLSVFQGRFHFREQICLIDALNFTAVYEAFASVEKQLAGATRFILNKTDLATPAEIRHIREILRRHHPDPLVDETTFGAAPLDWIKQPFPSGPLPQTAGQGDTSPPPSEAALAAEIKTLLNDPFRDMLPPDSVSSAVYPVAVASAEAFQRFIRDLPSGLLRGKGFVIVDGSVHLFGWVMGRGSLQPVTSRKIPETLVGRIVFIGPPDALRRLAAICTRHPLVTQKP